MTLVSLVVQGLVWRENRWAAKGGAIAATRTTVGRHRGHGSPIRKGNIWSFVLLAVVSSRPSDDVALPTPIGSLAQLC